MAADLVLVRFLTANGGYNAGETAGFSPTKANELIRLKYAEPFPVRAAVTKDTPKPVEVKESQSGLSAMIRGKRKAR